MEALRMPRRPARSALPQIVLTYCSVNLPRHSGRDRSLVCWEFDFPGSCEELTSWGGGGVMRRDHDNAPQRRACLEQPHEFLLRLKIHLIPLSVPSRLFVPLPL
jgi:hypothetical protein